MQRKQNNATLVILILTGLLLILFRNTLVLQIVTLLVGVGVLIYLDRMFLTEIRKEVERKTLEAKSKAKSKTDDAKLKLNAIIESIPSILVYINTRGEFDVYNRRFETLLDVDAKNVYDSQIKTPLRQILLDAFLNEKQFIRQEKFGAIDYQVLAIPMMRNNLYAGCMIIMQDVTRLLDGERMQQRFIADASHELKTPISSIKGMIEILNRDDFEDEATLKEFLSQIQIETARLQTIVEDLLLQSKLMADKVHLEKTEFNLRQFFEGLIYEKRRELHQNNIDVTLNCPSDVMIEADHFRLSQVFGNLFNNAINYAKNRSINIDCDISDKSWLIQFSDTGDGIDEAILPHIFERFYRGEESRDRNSGSTGLGLAISKSIIEAHGGSVKVKSAIGEGTNFQIKLK
ncbi:MAG TPA: HAMP domain-containing sensor histidine kinase [Erysipelothrix sp.]|nr:HAMP domain-containing sensor histidine kinase [Erysipelothrix sp.]